MKIILLEDILKLGDAGDVVKVSPGYGRNFLLPKNLAILATPKALKNLDKIKQSATEKAEKAKDALRDKADKLSGTELTFSRKADEDGHLYGSVSNIDIVNALNEKGFDIHKSMIKEEAHIKEVGSFDIDISFTSDIHAQIKVIVEAE